MPLDSNQMTAFLIVSLVVMALVIVSVTGILMGVWGSVVSRRSEAALKSEMLGRGMSADEIVRVIRARSDQAPEPSFAGASGMPCASEAVVERDGEWATALVLQTAEGAYYVHFVGESMDENEWVDPSRIRFPAGSPLTDLASSWHGGRNGAPRKEPMPQEV